MEPQIRFTSASTGQVGFQEGHEGRRGLRRQATEYGELRAGAGLGLARVRRWLVVT